jgi:cell division protein FtsN
MINPDRNLYEPPYDDALLYESDLEPERPRSRPLVVLLGIVVLAAFAGVVWVAYNQGVKQGQRGAPPILTADSGPTRIAPDETATALNGEPVPDKSYDRLLGEAPDQEDNILPAPEQPRTVPAPQDVASNGTVTAPTDSAGGPLESKATDIAPPVDPRMDSTVGVENLTPAVPSASSPSAATQPREDITSAVSAEPVPAAPRQITPPAATKPATIAQATPPAAKPAVVKPAAVTPPPAEAPVVAAPVEQPVQLPPAEMKVAALPPAAETPVAAPKPAAGGSVMIQLGSFPNDGLAASAWSKIKGSNQELLGSYSPSIKSAEIPGKGTWYRLRVGGFADKATAQQICEQLKASGQACIIAGK